MDRISKTRFQVDRASIIHISLRTLPTKKGLCAQLRLFGNLDCVSKVVFTLSMQPLFRLVTRENQDFGHIYLTFNNVALDIFSKTAFKLAVLHPSNHFGNEYCQQRFYK